MNTYWKHLTILLYLFGLISCREIEWKAYLDRIGPIMIGMSIDEVRHVLNDPEASVWIESGEGDDSGCVYLESNKLPESLGLMFQNRILVRFDIFEPGISTSEGAEVGDSEDTVKQIYPDQIEVAPHHYIPENGNYLYFIPENQPDAKQKLGIVFETADGIVTSYRFGTLSAISLVEGCN